MPFLPDFDKEKISMIENKDNRSNLPSSVSGIFNLV